MDIETAGIEEKTDKPFLADTTINPGWFYLGKNIKVDKNGADAGMSDEIDFSGSDSEKIRLTGVQLIQNLCDIVSKNGNVMLNVGLGADGSLPEAFNEELCVIGKWLKINGDAIYNTRPWETFGEGIFFVKNEGLCSDTNFVFTKNDIRFTTSKDGATLYAIVMDIPTKAVEIKSLAGTDVKSISLLGNDEDIKWQNNGEKVVIQPSDKWPSDIAVAYRISL